MRFRQIHLDFHNHGSVKIGERFQRKQFQEMLQLGNVNSITVFAKCFHGWAYYDTEQFEKHPGLQLDLLKEMIEAAHEIGVRTPVYINIGLNEQLARRHPEWLARDENDKTHWSNGFLEPGLHTFCFNSPYLERAVRQIEEVTARYDADGLFLDIVFPKACYCHNCLETMRQEGLDPGDYHSVMDLAERVYARYVHEVNTRVRAIKPDMAIVHNSGIGFGRRDLIATNSHLEVESLPSGGWGYHYFPMSVRYLQSFGKPVIGMTGRFNQNWGEFGGYKHPHAYRYEMSLCLVHGAGCSVGDHLHPDGVMDPIVYKMVGQAYREVETKEPWCTDVRNVADIGVLAVESLGRGRPRMGSSDKGVYRILAEGQLLYDFIDIESDFESYRVIVLPDAIRLDESLAAKLNRYLEQGGKVLATGRSGLMTDQDAFAIPLGVNWTGVNPYRPSFYRPHTELKVMGEGAFVLYSEGYKVELTDAGTELGNVEDPYFNRSWDAYYFTHTPNSHNDAGPGMVESDHGIYFAWNAFEDYAEHGSYHVKEIILSALNRLLGTNKTLETSLPSYGVSSVQHQEKESRYVHHLLYGTPVKRGSHMEVIEDLVPIHGVDVTLRLPVAASRVYLAPQGEDIPYTQNDGEIHYQVPAVDCHQMVVIDYDSGSEFMAMFNIIQEEETR